MDEFDIQRNKAQANTDLPAGMVRHAGKKLENLRLLPLDVIEPDPNQPRKIDPKDKSIKDLAESIKEHGVMNPIHVVHLAEDKYQIVNGERRFRASQKAKIDNIPAIILTEEEVKGESDKAVKQIVDNLQREDLKPLEEAEGYLRLQETFGLEQKDIAAKVGKSKSIISETISLNNLPDPIKEKIRRVELKIPKRFLIKLAREKNEKKQSYTFSRYLKANETEVRARTTKKKEIVLRKAWEFKEIVDNPTFKVVVQLAETPAIKESLTPRLAKDILKALKEATRSLEEELAESQKVNEATEEGNEK